MTLTTTYEPDVTDSESEERFAFNNRNAFPYLAKTIRRSWSADRPFSSGKDAKIDPEALGLIAADVLGRAQAEIDFEEHFYAELPDEKKHLGFEWYMRATKPEEQIRWQTPIVLDAWRKRAKRYGEICGGCFREFSADETIYIDRITEDYSDEGADSFQYGPVGECCVSWELKRSAKAAEEAGAPRGLTWSGKDDYAGSWSYLTVIATPADCEVCGRHMFVRSASYFSLRKHHFCSERCKSRLFNKRRSEKSAAARAGKVCPICTREFTPKRRDAKTCSPACKQKMHRMWKSLEAS
jgi:hypothetical protein